MGYGGRPKGSGLGNYTMSNAAVNQRIANAAKINGKSYVLEKVISDSDLSEEQKDVVRKERLNLWRKLSAPVLLLTDEYAELKSLINIKRLQGEDILGKDIVAASKLLLDISKEINRLTQVSADKKIDILAQKWTGDEIEDITIEVDSEDDERDNEMDV